MLIDIVYVLLIIIGNMIKTKNRTIHLPLVVVGYTLFSLLVIATLLSTTIPFGRMLFDPRVLHFNVAVTAIALTVGSVLPVLVGYIIGNYSVKSKSKLSHHFNGILLGLLGYWMMTSLAVLITIPDGLFTDYNMRIVFFNLFPGIGIGVITTILAILHVRSRYAKQDILEYRPFSVVLIVLIFILPVWSLVNNIITNTVNVYSFVSLAIIFVLGLISYASLRKVRFSKYRRLVWSAISVSVVFVAMYISFQLIYAIATYLDPRPTMESQAIVSLVGFILALVGWVIYWKKQVKVLR